MVLNVNFKYFNSSDNYTISGLTHGLALVLKLKLKHTLEKMRRISNRSSVEVLECAEFLLLVCTRLFEFSRILYIVFYNTRRDYLIVMLA